MMVVALRCAVVLVLSNAFSTAFASASSVSHAAAAQPSPDAPPLIACFVEAGRLYRIDPLLLYAIAEVESKHNPVATNRNKDGSVDYGLMQVNSQHLPRLKSQGIDANRLLEDPCLSIHTGASILADMVARHGYTWVAVGAYNAGSGAGRSQARQRYATKVWRSYSSLVSARSSTTSRHSSVFKKAAGTQAKQRPKQKTISGFRWSGEGDQLVSLPKSTSLVFGGGRDECESTVYCGRDGDVPTRAIK